MLKYYFSKIVDRYLNQWICLATWDSMHPLDMERFYQFLKALKRYSRKDWLVKFHENILRAAKEKHPERDEARIIESIDFFLGRAEAVFDYESAEFPNHFVEMKNPYLVSLYLRKFRWITEEGHPRAVYTSDKIEEILAENFGRDWRNQERWK